jgi:hypothetical protein
MNINGVNLYVYFGAITMQSEIMSFMKQLGRKDHMYGFVMEHGLQYQSIGNVNKSKEIVIGKELFLNSQDSLFRFQDVFTENTKLLSKLGSNFKTFDVDEALVREKLLQVGVFTEPQFYVIANYM